jgi:hypothetical protein
MPYDRLYGKLAPPNVYANIERINTKSVPLKTVVMKRNPKHVQNQINKINEKKCDHTYNEGLIYHTLEYKEALLDKKEQLKRIMQEEIDQFDDLHEIEKELKAKS